MLSLQTKWIGILFCLLSLAITLTWFKDGLYYGGAEVGVGPYYNPSRFLEIQKFIWWDSTAPGIVIPQFIAGVPLYFAFSLLDNVFSPLVLQSTLFFYLLFMMGFGMYFFSLSILGKDKTKYALLAGIFYMFNSYTMVSVWHRFLYTGIFLTASLPILAFLWKQWISKGKFIFLTLFLLINLLFVFMYANLTSLLVVWILCFLITIPQIAIPWNGKKHALDAIFKFLLGFLLFLLINSWWLIPVIKVSTGVLSHQHDIEESVSTLVNISKQTVLPFTLQMANPFYLFYSQELGGIYTHFIFRVLPWLSAGVIFIGVIVSLRNKIFSSFGLSYLVAVLIAKGATNPFGYPYIWGFMNIFALGVIRNPFEKMGVLMPFMASILFVVGLETLLLFCNKRLGKNISKLLILTVLTSIIIYAFPMFTGRVFNKHNNSLKVKVPQFYKDADNWLKEQKTLQGNILHLPFPERDVVTYNWEYGYHGVEINEILFTALPSITRNVGIKRVDDTLQSLNFIFSKPFLNDDQILHILQSLNVGYIVLHKETKWNDTQTYGKNTKSNNPLSLETSLNNLNFLEVKEGFGDLVIYKLKDSFYKPKIVFSNNFDLIDAGDSNIMQTLSLSQNINQITPVEKELPDNLWESSSKVLIFPKTIMYSQELSKEALEANLNQSILNFNDSSLPFAELDRIKNKFSFTGELLSETLTNRIILASKNILELNKLRMSNDISSDSILKNYDLQIEEIFTKIQGASIQEKFRSTLLARTFTIHLYALEQFSNVDSNQSQFAKQIHNKLNNYLISSSIIPRYFSIGEHKGDTLQRRIHVFDSPKKDIYELLLTDADMLTLYPDILSQIDVRLDGKIIPVKAFPSDTIVHLANIELDKGVHEISYVVKPSSNLVPNINRFILEGKSQLIDNQTFELTSTMQTGSAATSVLPKINGGETYEITFEALIDNAGKFYIEVSEDSEEGGSRDNCEKTSCYSLEVVSAPKDWQRLSISTNPLNLATQEVNLRILLPINSSSLPSKLKIRNLRVNRLMDNNLVLRKIPIGSPHSSTPSAHLNEFRKISPVKYEGVVKLEKPSFMFFKETFNPGWVLKLISGNNIHRVDKHYLGNLFGNTYYIDKTGEYSFTLEYEPQKYVDYGIIITIVGWIGIFVALVYSEFRKKYES